MNYRILNTPEFRKEIKRLSSKYPSLRSDFGFLLSDLAENPTQGISLGNNLYKIRLAISSKRRGKSGGARIITYVQIVMQTIILISIYDKAERTDISDREIRERLKKYLS